ncbi:MAG: sigma-54-dependent Fis family transcriptional regulator, partial [Sedimentisphaerales bacterium]|nr:sigma-54-dependent Fis family transcriptional regulator [Sedimentisphaerales bacterium]
ELFGHIKGSFTGASADKDGKFLAANGGTIFLDEINSASPALQVKLLRLIQERQFEPVGSNQTQTVDVRIILATNKDLKAMVEQNLFREDLYYRINVINIQLPALNQRITDIPILAEHFLRKMCAYHNKKFSGFEPEVITALESYDWPGNVRELENAIERAVVLGRSNHIELYDLPENIINGQTYNTNDAYSEGTSLKKALELPEKEIIISALKKYNWNRNKTAEVLEINRTTLYKKMRYYNLGM